jgi:outer membrane protein assembly factor BamE
MRLLASLFIAALLAGCGVVYKIDVQQGNYVTQDLVDRLKPGMTKAEVRQLLGTPLLSDVFHANQWDYYFSNMKAGKAEDRSRLVVYFESDKVARFTGNGRPGTTPSAQRGPGPNPAAKAAEVPDQVKPSPAKNPASDPVLPPSSVR